MIENHKVVFIGLVENEYVVFFLADLLVFLDDIYRVSKTKYALCFILPQTKKI